MLQDQNSKSHVEKKQNISKRSSRYHLNQNNIRTFAPISPTLFDESSSRPQTPEVLLAKTMNNRNARPIDKNNSGIFTNIRMLFNQTSSAAKQPRNATYQTPQLIKSSILRNTVGQDIPSRGMGGAVFVAGHSQFLVTNCTFEDNSAQSLAGAIFAGLNVTLDIHETAFEGNKAFLLNGGAINVQQQVRLSITNCVFKDNSAEVIAGAICTGLDVILTIQGTRFVGNKAVYGGAIEVQQNLYIMNCVFKDNSAQNVAGAIFGAVNLTLDIQGTMFVGNKALTGGAICALDDVTLTVRETNFVSNKASGVGGAIAVHTASYLKITDCVFDNNTGIHAGGAIKSYFKTALDIRRTSFTRNRAWLSGAIDIGDQGYLRVIDCTFQDNHGEDMGGAFCASNSAVLDIQETNLTGNNASQGGAINVQGQANLSLTNCRLVRNFAIDGGGAIVAWGNVTLEIRETSLTGNSASRFGGAMFVSQSQCHIVQSVFHNNTAKAAGGAMFIQSKSSMKIENTNFTNNNGFDGGAIDIEKRSTLQANMCIFQENFAKQDGGAIVLDAYATTVITNCNFLANQAGGGSGGAIILNILEHTSIKGTSFLRNVASNAGGAITISAGTNVTIDNITCIGNHAVGFGGCLNINSVILTLSNSEISENVGYELGAGVSGSYSEIQVSHLSY